MKKAEKKNKTNCKCNDCRCNDCKCNDCKIQIAKIANKLPKKQNINCSVYSCG